MNNKYNIYIFIWLPIIKMKRVNYIIGIDPGFSKTGVAVLSIDLTTQEIKNVFTFFIHTNSLETDNIRIMSIMHQLYYILLFY